MPENNKENHPSARLRAGEIRVAMQEEEVLWMDRKRKTILALPWSFTKYTLTPSRLLIQTGFLTSREEEIRLYRIRDITYSQSLAERMAGTGTLHIMSSDATTPELLLQHIKNAKKVKDVLSQAIEISRRENGVHASEMVGGMPGHHHPGDGCQSLGPELAPDANGNGVDDRLE